MVFDGLLLLIEEIVRYLCVPLKTNRTMKKAFVVLLILLSTASVASAQTNRAFKKGYRATIEVTNSAVFGKNKIGGLIQANTTHGYRFGDGFFLGAGFGIGYDMLADDFFIPLYMDAKYNFLDQKISPFVNLRTGIRYNGGVHEQFADFISVSGGVDTGRFSVKLGYEYGATRRRTWTRQGGAVEAFEKPSQLFCSFVFNL